MTRTHALYNCKHAGDQYRITKFDADANVEASYLTDGVECDCPAGVRPTCRHRKMLPLFKASKGTNGNLFYDFDAGTWLEVGEPESSISEPSINDPEYDEMIEAQESTELDAISESAEGNQPDRSNLRRI